MGDVILLPSNEHDEAILEAWQAGKSTRTLAREFGMRQSEVEQALDRMLPAIDAPNQLRAFKRELERMERLAEEYHRLAMTGDHEAAHVTLRANERICAMRGLGRIDPLQVQLVGHRDRETSTAALEAALAHLAAQRPDPTSGDVGS